MAYLNELLTLAKRATELDNGRALVYYQNSGSKYLNKEPLKVAVAELEKKFAEIEKQYNECYYRDSNTGLFSWLEGIEHSAATILTSHELAPYHDEEYQDERIGELLKYQEWQNSGSEEYELIYNFCFDKGIPHYLSLPIGVAVDSYIHSDRTKKFVSHSK